MNSKKKSKNWDWFNFFWLGEVVNGYRGNLDCFTYANAVIELKMSYNLDESDAFILNYRVTKTSIIKELFKE